MSWQPSRAMLPLACPCPAVLWRPCSPTTHSSQHVITVIVLTAAAFLGGALNSLAGGGSLVTFPALLFAGLNPIVANASSVVALFPATFTSVWAYRHSMVEVKEVSVTALVVTSLVGGLVGALLLLWTPTAVFAALVPWLVLLSTVIFAVGNFAPLELIRRL